MNTDIMVKILSMLDAKMKSQNWNVILFIDNAPCHPQNLKGKVSNINVCFLPKNTTSHLQPLDAGIIQNFKAKYRKLLLKFVISRVNDKKTASEIVKEVDVLTLLAPGGVFSTSSQVNGSELQNRTSYHLETWLLFITKH